MASKHSLAAGTPASEVSRSPPSLLLRMAGQASTVLTAHQRPGATIEGGGCGRAGRQHIDLRLRTARGALHALWAAQERGQVVQP